MHAMEVGFRMITSKRKINTFLNLTSRLVPTMAIVFLVVAGMMRLSESRPSEVLEKYHEVIARQISAFPFQIGKWVGQDVIIPTSAQEILNPNGLISRRYSRYGSEGALTFALIHCIDMRDMHGHHPPRCYPASGWSFQEEGQGDEDLQQETLAVQIGDIQADMSVNRFWRADQMVSRNEMVVVSIFITPMAGMVNDMTVLQEIGSMGRGASSLGVAQIQLVFSGDLSKDDLSSKVNDFMANMPDELLQNMLSLPESEELENFRNYTFDGSDRS
jgi:hypothetical protein